MRRLTRLAPALLAALALAGCGDRFPRTTDSDGLATMIETADPRTESQLIHGFYGVENNAWRWAAGHFSVRLRPPANASRNGAILVLKFGIPKTVLDRLKEMTLSCAIGGVTLDPEQYVRPGDHTYSRDVAPGILAAKPVNVAFAFDRFLPAGTADWRELSAVVTMVGFEAKQ
jgi:hypothetical protein